MDIGWLEKYCLSFAGTSHEVKWGNDLCFMVAGKMFCVAGLSQPLSISFKVPDDDFDELSATDGFMPAPYMARAKWVLVKDPAKLRKKDLEDFIRGSYELVKQKLSRKLRKELGLD